MTTTATTQTPRRVAGTVRALVVPCVCCGKDRNPKNSKFCDPCRVAVNAEAQRLYKLARQRAIFNVRRRHNKSSSLGA